MAMLLIRLTDKDILLHLNGKAITTRDLREATEAAHRVIAMLRLKLEESPIFRIHKSVSRFANNSYQRKYQRRKLWAMALKRHQLTRHR
jgi:hypothetical protein